MNKARPLSHHCSRYEKRVRDLSSLEKIYEYFATNKDPVDGHQVMNAQDVVRALVPTYPPMGSNVERAGYLEGECPTPKIAGMH